MLGGRPQPTRPAWSPSMRRALCAVLMSLAPAWLAAQEPETAETPAPRPEPQQQPPRDDAAARRTAAPVEVQPDMVRDLAWRGLGPANPMGRITDIEVAATDPSRWFI